MSIDSIAIAIGEFSKSVEVLVEMEAHIREQLKEQCVPTPEIGGPNKLKLIFS